MPARKTAAVPAIERIREIAYQLWIDAGKPEGAADSNWFDAERVAAAELVAAKATRKAPVRRKVA